MIEINSIKIPDEFVDLCEGWHGGQSSMLYAISSTENLTTGSIKPPRAETDEQWYLGLWRELSMEIYRNIKAAREYEPGDVDALTRFDGFVDGKIAEMEADFGLTDA